MSFNSVDAILKSIIEWEKDFDTFYNAVSDHLTDPPVRQIAQLLKLRHKIILEELQNIDLKKYQLVEFVKFVPEYQNDDPQEISPDASLEDILCQTMNHEEGRIRYFTRLINIVSFEHSKEVFDMLIRMKMWQIKEIKGLLNSYHLTM